MLKIQTMTKKDLQKEVFEWSQLQCSGSKKRCQHQEPGTRIQNQVDPTKHPTPISGSDQSKINEGKEGEECVQMEAREDSLTPCLEIFY